MSGPRNSWPACRIGFDFDNLTVTRFLILRISYPTYAMGAQLAGCRAVSVPLDQRGAGLISKLSMPGTRTVPSACGRTRPPIRRAHLMTVLLRNGTLTRGAGVLG